MKEKQTITDKRHNKKNALMTSLAIRC